MSEAGEIQALRRDLERARRLVDASYALHTTLDLDELLGLILEAAKAGVSADRGTVFLLTDDRRELWSRVLSGEESLEIRLPVGQGIAGSVAATGTTVNLADAYDDPRFDRSWDVKTGYRTQELLTAPIRNREGAVVGVFQMLNRSRADGPFGGEDESFLASLSIHAALAVENARLHRASLEKERQDREIQLVQNVQRAYQPERMDRTSGVLACAGMNQLCEHASGDYYDAFPLDDGRLIVAIGDVSGHGLGAALVMAQARALLHVLAPTVDDVPQLLARLNEHLARDLTGGRFMTLFVAVADPATGTLAWSSAGHPPALLARASGAQGSLEPQGLVLGVLPGSRYKATTPVTLEPGDVLLLYTDGATEARRSDATMLEEDGLRRILAGLLDRDPPGILDGVRDAIVAWTGSATFPDDLTLLALKRQGPASARARPR